MTLDLNAITEQRLLQAMVEVARFVYGAAAASVFKVDSSTGDLTFAAVAGEGERALVGTSFPVGTGIAGWVASSCQVVINDDLTESTEFSHDAATSTGFVPSSIMAAPLVADGECVGVLEVLDRYTRGSAQPRGELADTELLGLLATQAALGLELLKRSAGTTEGANAAVLLAALNDQLLRGPLDKSVNLLLTAALEISTRDDKR